MSNNIKHAVLNHLTVGKEVYLTFNTEDTVIATTVFIKPDHVIVTLNGLPEVEVPISYDLLHSITFTKEDGEDFTVSSRPHWNK